MVWCITCNVKSKGLKGWEKIETEQEHAMAEMRVKDVGERAYEEYARGRKRASWRMWRQA